MATLLVTGKHGKMGQAIIAAAKEKSAFTTILTYSQGEDLASLMQQADVCIDFTNPSLTADLLTYAKQYQTALVIGTTGYNDEQKAAISTAAKQIAIVFSPNFSTGVNTLFWLTEKATKILQYLDSDIEVVEMHHRHKIDAPSGTAEKLLAILLEQTERNYQDHVQHGRVGHVGPRDKQEIGMHTLRGGDVVGDHTVIYAAEGERIELTHKASSRMTFAKGSVQAALWVQNHATGLYDMQDVLGLK